MTNKPPPFKGLTIGIPTIIPIKGRGLVHQGSTLVIEGLGFRVEALLWKMKDEKKMENETETGIV